MDFVRASGMCTPMDTHTADLIATLCAQTAMIMEDVVDSALTIGSVESDERTRRLHELTRGIDRMRSLIDAALALEG